MSAAPTESTGPKPTNTPGRIVPDSKPTQAPDYNEFDAWNICKDAVRERLKAPASAEFSNVFDADIKDEGDGHYIMSGYVDAQNALGVALRHDFVCEVQHTRGSSYRLLNLAVIPR